MKQMPPFPAGVLTPGNLLIHARGSTRFELQALGSVTFHVQRVRALEIRSNLARCEQADKSQHGGNLQAAAAWPAAAWPAAAWPAAGQPAAGAHSNTTMPASAFDLEPRNSATNGIAHRLRIIIILKSLL